MCGTVCGIGKLAADVKDLHWYKFSISVTGKSPSFKAIWERIKCGSLRLWVMVLFSGQEWLNRCKKWEKGSTYKNRVCLGLSCWYLLMIQWLTGPACRRNDRIWTPLMQLWGFFLCVSKYRDYIAAWIFFLMSLKPTQFGYEMSFLHCEVLRWWWWCKGDKLKWIWSRKTCLKKNERDLKSLRKQHNLIM